MTELKRKEKRWVEVQWTCSMGLEGCKHTHEAHIETRDRKKELDLTIKAIHAQAKDISHKRGGENEAAGSHSSAHSPTLPSH